MPSFANAVLGVTVTMSGTKPFAAVKNAKSGTIAIADNAGVLQTVQFSKAAVIGHSGATAETAGSVFADNKRGNAIVAEILADFNA